MNNFEKQIEIIFYDSKNQLIIIHTITSYKYSPTTINSMHGRFGNYITYDQSEIVDNFIKCTYKDSGMIFLGEL